MFRIRSFERRIFLTLLVVAMVPTAITVGAATLVLSEMVSSAGTAGPWDAVAESGRALIDAAGEAPSTPRITEASARHQEALSESVRLSRIYALLADRFLAILPLFGLMVFFLVGVLSFLSARLLSRQFSGPIEELVGWAGLIAKAEPLPSQDVGGAAEFRVLRGALRTMSEQLAEGRRRDIESARLRSWTEMARRVAHELKNPLMPMRMAAVTVSRQDDPETRESGEVLLEEIQRLDEMARTFAQFGRMPEGPMADVDLAEALELLAKQHTHTSTRVVIRRPESLAMVRGYYDPLLRAMRNLVLNAVEASEGRSQEVVTVTLEEKEGAVEILIADRGKGIPPEIMESIWDPGVTSKGGGTGLGLAMARQTILAHGGSIFARNRAGGGAEFIVSLPAGTEST